MQALPGGCRGMLGSGRWAKGWLGERRAQNHPMLKFDQLTKEWFGEKRAQRYPMLKCGRLAGGLCQHPQAPLRRSKLRGPARVRALLKIPLCIRISHMAILARGQMLTVRTDIKSVGFIAIEAAVGWFVYHVLFFGIVSGPLLWARVAALLMRFANALDHETTDQHTFVDGPLSVAVGTRRVSGQKDV